MINLDATESLRGLGGRTLQLCSLPRLEARGLGPISRLPVCLRILLEGTARRAGSEHVTLEDVEAVARWSPRGERVREVPFVPGRILLQDFTGVPLVVDLAALRSAITRRGGDPARVRPRVPMELVIDHSVQVDAWGTPGALAENMRLELERNAERYALLEWGARAFEGLRVIPPGLGICHQVNLEHLARGVIVERGVVSFDTVIGTDSHTTMIDGLGLFGIGVGGIEAEAVMLGRPIGLLTPDVVGLHLSGRLGPGVLATDLALAVTQLLRGVGVTGALVEIHGEGAATLSVPDRATVSNMAPEYGATLALFPPDEASCRYLEQTGRSREEVALFRDYHRAQGVFGMPGRGQLEYSRLVELELDGVMPSVSGPRRPQERRALSSLPGALDELLSEREARRGARSPRGAVGAGRRAHLAGGLQDSDTVPDGRDGGTSPLTEREMMDNRPTPDVDVAPGTGEAGRPGAREGARAMAQAARRLEHGSVVIAAITSCTNTSNPEAMITAGLLARRAAALGLGRAPWVKTSLAPGSRVVTEYLDRAGLGAPLAELGFSVVGYGCTTCIGNSGPLDPAIEAAIHERELVVAAVLSGNRNFEARIHQSVRASFLMSPPLVVAFAIAGRVDVDLGREPLGRGHDGPVFLAEVWPAPEEVAAWMELAADPELYRRTYAAAGGREPGPPPGSTGGHLLYPWDPRSTYVREPPYVEHSAPGSLVFSGGRALMVLGDGVTTDHISPAGAIKPGSPAGRWLLAEGVEEKALNTYGARRGNHEVMVRGTFANVRIRNLLLPHTEGGVARHWPSGQVMEVFEAAERYRGEGVPLLVIAGKDYGTGSSRDWAAKGAKLLGVRAIVAESFERIHRSNLVGMGVLPCQLPAGVTAAGLRIDGSETFDLVVPEGPTSDRTPSPRPPLHLVIHRTGGDERVPVVARLDTAAEVAVFLEGGVLPSVRRRLEAHAGELGPESSR